MIFIETNSVKMSDYEQVLPKGPQINVFVESTFEEGMVVCYTDQTGQEYRGALLSLSPVPPDHIQRVCGLQAVCQVSRKLANPLTYVHDHPYSDLTKYAKHVSKIPSEVVMNWTNFPKSYNLEEIGTRRQNLAHIPLRTDPDQLSLPQIRGSKVVINPVKEEKYISHLRKDIPKVTGRAAKINANSRIFGMNNDMFVNTDFNRRKRSRSVDFKKKDSKHGAKFTALKSRNKPRNRHRTFSPPVPSVPRIKNKRQAITSPSHTSDSNSPSPKPKPRVCLKNFSVPLVRVNVPFVRFSTPPSTTSISPSPPPESVSSYSTNHSVFSVTSSGSSVRRRSISSISDVSDTPYVIVVD